MLTFLLITHNDAPWLEATWHRLRQVVQPGDHVSIVDGGSQDETPIILQHLVTNHPLPVPLVAPVIFLPQTTPADLAAWRSTALSAVDHPTYLVWVAGSDQLIPEAIHDLRSLIAKEAPPAVLHPQALWYGEPDVVLDQPRTLDWGGVVTAYGPSDPAPVWPKEMTLETLWQVTVDLRAQGAVDRPHPVSASCIPSTPALPPMELNPEGRITMILNSSCASGGSDKEWEGWSETARLALIDTDFGDLKLSAPDKSFLFALQAGGNDAANALLQKRMLLQQTLVHALKRRLLALRASYDAMQPDAEKLIRAFARMHEEAKTQEV